MTSDLLGRTIIVTGAAGGIGENTARLLAKQGARIVLTDVDGRVEEVADEIRTLGGEAISVIADVTSESQVKSMVDEAVSAFGTPTGAVNCAGVEQHMVSLAALTLQQWDRVLRINLTGAFLCMKYQILAMLDNGRGSIVNIASALGASAIPSAGEYIASKHGLAGLTKAAALDYAASGIRVNAIMPGVIRTPMIARHAADPGASEFIDTIRKQHPIGRFGEPGEVAEAAKWLLSDAASFVTGALVAVDGGCSAR